MVEVETKTHKKMSGFFRRVEEALLGKYDSSEQVSAGNKRKVSETRSAYEQAAKRLRDSPETEAGKQLGLSALQFQFWSTVMPRLREFFSVLDFSEVAPFMEAIPFVNEAMRNDTDAWRQRIILEYPQYWDLYADEIDSKRLSEFSISELLSDARRGSSPRSREPNRNEANYLLYQKARRLSRFTQRVATDEKFASSVTVQMPFLHEPIRFSNQHFLPYGNGCFIYSPEYTREEAPPDSAEPPHSWIHLRIFDLQQRQVRTSERTHSIVSRFPGRPGWYDDATLRDNGQYVLVKWPHNGVSMINLVNLRSGAWMFNTPLGVIDHTLPATNRFFVTSLGGLTESNRLRLDIVRRIRRDSDGDDEAGQDNPVLPDDGVLYYTVTYEVQVSLRKLIEFANQGGLKGGRPLLREYADKPSKYDLHNGLVVQASPIGRDFAEITHYALPDPVSIMIDKYIHISQAKQSNFHISYDQPLIYVTERQDGPVVSDGVESRTRGEWRSEAVPYSVQWLPGDKQNAFIELEDNSDYITWGTGKIRFKVPWALTVPGTRERAYVFANWIVVVRPVGRVGKLHTELRLLDMWEWYRANRDNQTDQMRPLVSEQH